MKGKRILTALAVLAIVTLGLFVSCSDNIMDDAITSDDALVWATFDKRSTRGDVSSTYTQTVTLKDKSEVYWTYTAEKDDKAGHTGETKGQTAVKSNLEAGLDGVIGKFSQGDWKFTVYGYKKGPDEASSGDEDAIQVAGQDTEDTNNDKYYSGLIYKSKETRVTLKLTSNSGTYDNPDPINVIIDLLTDGTGTFEISNASDFSWKDDSNEAHSNMYLTMLATKNGSKSPESSAFALTYNTTSGTYRFADEVSKLSWNDWEAGSWNMVFSIVESEGETTTLSYSDNAWTGIKYTYATSPELLVKVYVGQTTTLSASIIEENFAYGKFYGDIDYDGMIASSTVTTTVKSGSDTVLKSQISPASVSSNAIATDKATTVTIPSAVNAFGSGSTASLTVTAYPIVAANSMFTVTTKESSVVGAIDLTATVRTEEKTSTVEKFLDSNGYPIEVTVSTYITKSLDTVTLTSTIYGSEETWSATASSATDNNIKAPSGGDAGVCYYDEDTGLLVFRTTHFSTFLVSATDPFIETITNEACNQDAVSWNIGVDAVSKRNYILLKDVSLESYLAIGNCYRAGSEVTLDLAGHTLKNGNTDELDDKGASAIQLSNGGVTLNVINSSSREAVITSGNRGISIQSENNKVTIGVNIKVSAPYSGVYVQGESTLDVCGTVETTATSGLSGNKNGYAIEGNGSSDDKYKNTKITIHDGAVITSAGSTAIYHPQIGGALEIKGGTITGKNSAVEMRAGTLTVSGTPILEATSETYSCIENSNGSTTIGAAVAVAQHTTKQPITVTISGGTFSGYHALSVKNPQKNAITSDTAVKVTVKGGTFNSSGDDDAVVVDSTYFTATGNISNVSENSPYTVESNVSE